MSRLKGITGTGDRSHHQITSLRKCRDTAGARPSEILAVGRDLVENGVGYGIPEAPPQHVVHAQHT